MYLPHINLRQSLYKNLYVLYFALFCHNQQILLWTTCLCSINLYTFCIVYRKIYKKVLWITLPLFVEMWITYPLPPTKYAFLCTNIQFLHFIHKNLYAIHCANVDNLYLFIYFIPYTIICISKNSRNIAIARVYIKTIFKIGGRFCIKETFIYSPLYISYYVYFFVLVTLCE